MIRRSSPFSAIHFASTSSESGSRGEPYGRFGMGLGLSIAQHAAQRCGLKIVLSNRQDRSGLIARLEPLAVVAAPAPAGPGGRAVGGAPVLAS